MRSKWICEHCFIISCETQSNFDGIKSFAMKVELGTSREKKRKRWGLGGEEMFDKNSQQC